MKKFIDQTTYSLPKTLMLEALGNNFTMLEVVNRQHQSQYLVTQQADGDEVTYESVVAYLRSRFQHFPRVSEYGTSNQSMRTEFFLELITVPYSIFFPEEDSPDDDEDDEGFETIEVKRVFTVTREGDGVIVNLSYSDNNEVEGEDDDDDDEVPLLSSQEAQDIVKLLPALAQVKGLLVSTLKMPNSVVEISLNEVDAGESNSAMHYSFGIFEDEWAAYEEDPSQSYASLAKFKAHFKL